MIRNVGQSEIGRFYTDKRRFPALDKYAIAVILVLLIHVSWRRGADQYLAWPSYDEIAERACVSRGTVIARLRSFEPWLRITPGKRRGRRQPSNLYDVRPAVEEILRAARPRSQRSP